MSQTEGLTKASSGMRVGPGLRSPPLPRHSRKKTPCFPNLARAPGSIHSCQLSPAPPAPSPGILPYPLPLLSPPVRSLIGRRGRVLYLHIQ